MHTRSAEAASALPAAVLPLPDVPVWCCGPCCPLSLPNWPGQPASPLLGWPEREHIEDQLHHLPQLGRLELELVSHGLRGLLVQHPALGRKVVSPLIGRFLPGANAFPNMRLDLVELRDVRHALLVGEAPPDSGPCIFVLSPFKTDWQSMSRVPLPASTD
jgi:hypothetical protein